MCKSINTKEPFHSRVQERMALSNLWAKAAISNAGVCCPTHGPSIYRDPMHHISKSVSDSFPAAEENKKIIITSICDFDY